MGETYNKKEKEKKRQQRKKEKLARKEDRKENSKGGGLESMMAYVDENGVIRDTPPDPAAKQKIKAGDIEIGVPKKEKEDFDPVIGGMINFFDSSKGYGFIKGEDGENYFVHINNVSGHPEQGSKVRFEKEKGPKGWVAVRVMIG